MTKITKDELIKLNAELQNELATLKAQDESLREDLSSVLNAPTLEAEKMMVLKLHTKIGKIIDDTLSQITKEEENKK